MTKGVGLVSDVLKHFESGDAEEKKFAKDLSEKIREAGFLKVSSAVGYMTADSSVGPMEIPDTDRAKEYYGEKLDTLLTPQDGDKGISGNVALDVHTLMQKVGSQDSDSGDHFDDKAFRYAWDLKAEAREQGFDKTADAIEEALSDGVISRLDGEGNEITRTFAEETGSFGNKETAKTFDDDMDNGYVSGEERKKGEKAVDKDIIDKSDDSLNHIADHYFKDGIFVEDRQVSGFKSDAIRPDFEKIVENYREAFPLSSAQEAADFAVDAIKDRLENAFGKDGWTDDDRKAIKIFKNYADKDDDTHLGRKDALDIARSSYAAD